MQKKKKRQTCDTVLAGIKEECVTHLLKFKIKELAIREKCSAKKNNRGVVTDTRPTRGVQQQHKVLFVVVALKLNAE